MSIKYSALNLPEDIIPLQTGKVAFRKAKELLNDKNGICKEASSHPRIFGVKSFSNEIKFRQKVKIKIIYNATVVYFHGITFAATH